MGHVYILRNEHFPALIKIGRTKNAVSERVAQLNGTGTPGVTTELYHCGVDDEIELEKLVHKYLVACRDSPNKEYFRISASEARKTIRTVAIENNILIKKESSSQALNREDHNRLISALRYGLKYTLEQEQEKKSEISNIEHVIKRIESSWILVKSLRRGDLLKKSMLLRRQR